MFHVFAGKGGSKTLSDDRQRTIFAGESSGDDSPIRHVRMVILGTGFAGLGIAIRLKQQRQDDFIVIERATDSGGTWRDNTYPGCACDIPSHLYSFSFALNPHWSHMYSPQREIWDYLRDCMERFGILPHIQWNCELLDASWNEDDQRWHLTTTRGQLLTDILILGNGPLSEPSLPSIPGIEHFEGVTFHSAQWKHDYDLTGKRVAVIGTGASAIQFVPQIQPVVSQMTLFQRTPPWIIPRQDHPIPSWQRKLFRFFPLAQRLLRARIYWRQELTALAFVYRPARLESAMQATRHYLASQIQDPVLREKLTPHYMMGCKRILLSDDFYPALNQPNVEVVTERIREVRAHSVVTEDGTEHEVDTIIFGTGFHVTDTTLPGFIHGRGGRSLADKWKDGPNAYLGTAVSEFPNMFLLIGPNTGLGHNSMVFMIESQIRYILHCLRMMDQRQMHTVEIREEAQEAFNNELQRKLQNTVWMSGCASWYLDARGKNTTIWPGFTFEYRFKTARFDPGPYDMHPRHASVPLKGK